MSEWSTIRVILTGRRGAPLAAPPGRVLLVCADHTVADLADAIDTAFGRWDLSPLRALEVDGRVLGGGTGADAADRDDTEDVTVGELGLRAGSRFSYLFDLSEGWRHDCAVEADDVDPLDLLDEEPDLPVPVFGWGTVPDQYGRVVEDDEPAGGRAGGEGAGSEEDEEGEEDWAAAEAASWDVVAHALAPLAPPPDGAVLASAAAALRSPAPDGGDVGAPAVAVLYAAAGIDPADAPGDDEDLWTRLAAGVVRPDDDVPLDEEAAAAWAALEPADWAGAVIELVRAGPGTTASPEVLVGLVARCPEVEGDELSEEDEAAILEGFEVVVALWRALGVLGDAGELTALGAWGLPRALERAWASQG